MRVTANTFPDSLARQLQRLSVQQNRFQQMAATGQKIQRPEDNPTAMRRVLDLQGESQAARQYIRNIDLERETATLSYAAMKGLKTVTDRAAELATRVDSLRSQDELNIFAKEISELMKHAVQLANSKDRGEYLFAGTKTGTPPFLLKTDADGFVTSVVYQGNTDIAPGEIDKGVLLTAQAIGANSSATGPRGLISDGRSGADLFQHLINFQDNLRSGDVDAIQQTDRPALEKDEENLLFHIGTNAAMQSRLETTRSILQKRTFSLEKLVSNEADADLAQTMVRLQQTQTAYQAAVQSGGNILSRSLLDYLR